MPDIDPDTELRNRLLAEVPDAAEHELAIPVEFYKGINFAWMRHYISWGTGPCPLRWQVSPAPVGHMETEGTEDEQQLAERRGITVSELKALPLSAQWHVSHWSPVACPLPVFSPNRIDSFHRKSCDPKAQGYRIVPENIAGQLVRLYEIAKGGTLRSAECGVCWGWYVPAHAVEMEGNHD